MPPDTFLKFRLSLGSGNNPTEPDFGVRLTWNGKGILGQGDDDAKTGDQFPTPLQGGLRVLGIGGTLHGSVFGDDVTAGATYQREFGRGDEGRYGRLDLSIGVLAGNRDLAINPSIPDGIPANSESFAFHSSATTLQESLSFPFLQPGPSVGATAVVTDNRNFEVGVSAGISLVLPQSVPLIGGALADYTFYDADHPHAAGGAAGSLLDLIVGNPKITGSSVWNQQTDAGQYVGIRVWGKFRGVLRETTTAEAELKRCAKRFQILRG